MPTLKVDFGGYPAAEGDPRTAFRYLDPDYMVGPPTLDGWGTLLHYRALKTKDGLAASYTLSSAGSDGRFQGYLRSSTRYFECDIIYADGQFIAAPSGVCRS